MPALLTAIVITCGALKAENSPTACRAHVYHGAYNEPAACTQTAQELALEFESNLVALGTLTKTQSYGECVAAADTDNIVSWLPKFMQQEMGANSTRVVHFDLVDGVAVERVEGKPAKKVVKGAAI
jgi:hypothetical protein